MKKRIEELVNKIKNNEYCDFESLEELAFYANLSKEWEEADLMTFEKVIGDIEKVLKITLFL